MAVTETAETELVIQPLKQGEVRLRIIGTQPMFQNRMSAKAKQQLLVGGKKKTAAEKALVKHDPLREFRDAAEIMKSGPTALGVRIVAIKAAMCTAAIETEGLTKAGTQRLLFLPGELTPLYGVPQLRMDVVRSADINKTPDVRTRVFLPRWGAEVTIKYISPQLNLQAVVQLLTNAGQLIGLGDYRQEKGKGGFGLFRVLGTEENDEEWDELTSHHGREAQLDALEAPQFADDDTRELFEFCRQEAQRRAA